MKIRKMTVHHFLTIFVCLSLMVIGISGNCEAQAPAKKVVTLKLAHQWPQDLEDYVILTGVKYANEVEKRSNGSIKIQFFPAESLVKARDTHKALKDGVIDMSIYPYVYAAGVVPELNIFLFPGSAISHDNFYAWGNSEVMRYIEERLNQQLNIKTLLFHSSCTGFVCTKKMIRVPADLAGLKARVPNKYCQVILKEMGAGIAHMPSSEVYIALQRGVLDFVSAGTGTLASYKMFEVTKYHLSPENYGIEYSLNGVCISMHAWNRLDPEQKRIMIEVGKDLMPFSLEASKRQDIATAALFTKAGRMVEKMTKEQAGAWIEASKKYAFDRFRSEIPRGDWILEKTLEIVKKYQ